MANLEKKPNVVVIGGGTGVSVVLKSLKDYDVNLTAIVTVADDGGSSGKLRSENGQAPPGDARNVLAAMSTLPQERIDLFQHRFDSKNPTLGGHALGNFIIAALTEMEGDFSRAIDKLGDILEIRGRVLPSSAQALNLNCVFTDGARVVGETQIARYKKEIDYVYVTANAFGGTVQAGPGVVEAILEADMIVLGPGSLYTSLLPNLVIPDIGQAILETQAHILYICNIMEQKGETIGYTDADHVKVLHDHLGEKFVDTVLVNIGIVDEEYLTANIQQENIGQVRHDFQGLKKSVDQVISDNLLDLRDGGIYHNGKRLAREIVKMAKDHYTLSQTIKDS